MSPFTSAPLYLRPSEIKANDLGKGVTHKSTPKSLLSPPLSYLHWTSGPPLLLTSISLPLPPSDLSPEDPDLTATAVLYQPGQPPRTLHYHLRSSDDHMVFEAEVVGLILAAKLIHSTPEITLPINIFVDNQTIIISSRCPKSKPGHYILEKLRRLLLGIYRNHDITHKDICVSWVPGVTRDVPQRASRMKLLRGGTHEESQRL